MQKNTSPGIRKSFRDSLRHAFAVGDEGEPEPEAFAAMERLASHIVKRRLEAPAILFLQSSVPLSYIGSQAMVGLEPLVGPFFPKRDFERLSQIFERRDGIERLTICIEELVAERDANGK